jgi:hypothetical protein
VRWSDRREEHAGTLMVMKARGTGKVHAKKTNYMSGEAFADLEQALEDALAFERGKRRELVITRIQKPRPPKAGSPKRTSAKRRS